MKVHPPSGELSIGEYYFLAAIDRGIFGDFSIWGDHCPFGRSWGGFSSIASSAPVTTYLTHEHAAPHVKRSGSLILSQFSRRQLTEVRGRISQARCRFLFSGGKTTTGGRLNAYKALTVTGSGLLQSRRRLRVNTVIHRPSRSLSQ